MEEKLEERQAYVLLERTIFEVVLVARKCVEKCFKIGLNLAAAVLLLHLECLQIVPSSFLLLNFFVFCLV